MFYGFLLDLRDTAGFNHLICSGARPLLTSVIEGSVTRLRAG